MSGGSPPAEYSLSRFGPNFPPSYIADSSMSMKVLNPSSMNACRRSFDPTIIGNQLCPNSCAVSQKKSLPFNVKPSKTTPGYSIPDVNPPILPAVGQGYGYQCFENLSIVSFVYSVDMSHASGPTAS